MRCFWSFSCLLTSLHLCFGCILDADLFLLTLFLHYESICFATLSMGIHWGHGLNCVHLKSIFCMCLLGWVLSTQDYIKFSTVKKKLKIVVPSHCDCQLIAWNDKGDHFPAIHQQPRLRPSPISKSSPMPLSTGEFFCLASIEVLDLYRNSGFTPSLFCI